MGGLIADCPRSSVFTLYMARRARGATPEMVWGVVPLLAVMVTWLPAAVAATMVPCELDMVTSLPCMHTGASWPTTQHHYPLMKAATTSICCSGRCMVQNLQRHSITPPQASQLWLDISRAALHLEEQHLIQQASCCKMPHCFPTAAVTKCMQLPLVWHTSHHKLYHILSSHDDNHGTWCRCHI